MARARNGPDPNEIIERLRRHLAVLHLTQIAERLDEHLAWATRERPSPSELLERVLGEQAELRRDRRIERRIVDSGLPQRKTLEAFDWNFQPGLDRALMVELGALEWVRRSEDLIVTGKSGTGKSHLLMSFGLRACEQGLSVRYARCVDLLDDLHAGLADGSYAQRLKRWCSPPLLIVDDVGLGQVKQRESEPTAAHTLFNVIDRRHTRASTAVSSNLKLSEWGKYLGDATLAAAILDRLSMRALRVDIDGPSYRQHEGRARARGRGASSGEGPTADAASPSPSPSPPTA
jgi:DNA replication protein DnaC